MPMCLVPIMVLALAALSAGCNTAGAGFWGTTPHLAGTPDNRFLMRRAGSLVEVTRLSPEWRPRFAEIAHQAAAAVRAETGCAVAWIRGDPAMMILGLACPGAPVPARPKGATEILCRNAATTAPTDGRALLCALI